MAKTTNNTESLMLRRVAEVTQVKVANTLGRDSSYVSRFFARTGGLHIDELEDVFSTLGLKLIQCEEDTVTLPKEQYEALRILAKKGI